MIADIVSYGDDAHTVVVRMSNYKDRIRLIGMDGRVTACSLNEIFIVAREKHWMISDEVER